MAVPQATLPHSISPTLEHLPPPATFYHRVRLLDSPLARGQNDSASMAERGTDPFLSSLFHACRPPFMASKIERKAELQTIFGKRRILETARR